MKDETLKPHNFLINKVIYNLTPISKETSEKVILREGARGRRPLTIPPSSSFPQPLIGLENGWKVGALGPAFPAPSAGWEGAGHLR